MDSEVQHLLYDDDSGKPIGLPEVQLLEPPPADRMPRLRLLLAHGDEYVAYQAALILAAWGDKAGADYLEALVERWPEGSKGFAPHRIYGYDNACDLIADAMDIYGTVSDDEQGAKRVFRKLLGIYGPTRFESALQLLMLKPRYAELASDVETATDKALLYNLPDAAGRLLPALAKWTGIRALPVTRAVLSRGAGRDARLSVAEALQYVPGVESVAMLERLLEDEDNGVADQAARSLAFLRA